MSTSCSALGLSQAALASSVLASSGRMSYLSKSKLMSLSSATDTNSRGDGRAAGLVPGGVVGLGAAGGAGPRGARGGGRGGGGGGRRCRCGRRGGLGSGRRGRAGGRGSGGCHRRRSLRTPCGG